jgi:hypothetical protein
VTGASGEERVGEKEHEAGRDGLVNRLLRWFGVATAVGLALGGQVLLSVKGVSPYRSLAPGAALYLAAGALLLVVLRRREDDDPAARRPGVLPPGLEWGLVALVVVAGLYVRLHRIDLIPWGLNNDEAINALEAEEIVAGKPFATFTERGLNRETLFHYLAAFAYRHPGLGLGLLRAMPAVFAVARERIDVTQGGLLTELVFPVRSVAIAAGSLTILALYLFARDRFGWRVALVASALLAASPWHLLYSRVGERAVLAPLFAIATVGFFLKALESGRLRDHLAWGAALGLGFWSYTSFRAVPLALLTFALARRYLPGRGAAAPGTGAGVTARPAGHPALYALGLAGACVLFLMIFSGLSPAAFLMRGAYATMPPKAHWGLNLLHSLSVINYFPARYAVVQSDEFISDGMSTTYGLVGLEPETIVTAALATLGILYAAWRVARRRDAACALLLLCLAALDLTVGLAGPSLTRLLLNLPWLCLLAALMADRLFGDLAAVRPRFTAWAAGAVILALVATSWADGCRRYFLQAGRSENAMQNFGPVQTIMGMFVRSLPPGQEIYVLHTLRVDTLRYLIGNRSDVHLVDDPGSVDFEAVVRQPRTLTFVVEFARPFAEPLRHLMTRFPQGDMTQVADARFDPDKVIFYTFTLWKDAGGQILSPPGAAPAFPGSPP